MATSASVRSWARVVGALVAVTGLGILHGTADGLLGPELFLCGLAGRLAVFLLVLVGQTKAEADRAARLARPGRPRLGAGH